MGMIISWPLRGLFAVFILLQSAFLASFSIRRTFGVQPHFNLYGINTWWATRFLLASLFIHDNFLVLTMCSHYRLLSELLDKSLASWWWYLHSLFVIWWTTKLSLLDLQSFSNLSQFFLWASLGFLEDSISLFLIWSCLILLFSDRSI